MLLMRPSIYGLMELEKNQKRMCLRGGKKQTTKNEVKNKKKKKFKKTDPHV